MKLERFTASPDIVGGRVWLSWEYMLDALETPGDAPDILLRRKARDFEFPPLLPGDPYLIYDSAVFPPAPVPGSLQVIDLPTEEAVENGLRVVTDTISVAAVTAGQPIETQRRSRSIFYSRDGAPVRLRDSLLDAGELEPHAPYYYELDDGAAPGPEDIVRYRRVVAPGGAYGLNRHLYAMLPETYKNHDTRLLPAGAAFSGVPEASPFGGQLRRFVDVFGVSLDALRSSAESLRNLRDPQSVEARYLDPLSRMIGWEQSNTVAIPLQRNELQTATRLFDVVGTVPALAALVTHQTGWRAQVAEFAQHIARSNTPARRSLYARAEQPGGGWRGTEDAASIFAFPPGVATGAGVLPATLTSAAAEPFALRTGMELTITVDGGVPARVRFGPADFADLSAATAAEVVAVIAAAFETIEAEDIAGSVVLRTVLTGPESSLSVEASESSLLALSDAPDGQIAAISDSEGRLRLIYEQRRDAARDEAAANDPARSDLLRAQAPATALAPTDMTRRILAVKNWAYGQWRGEEPVPDWTGEAYAPTADGLADGRMILSWLDRERPAGEQLRLTIGLPQSARPASILGRRAGPFALTAGTQIAFVGSFGTETFTVAAVDYASIAAATPVEVATAIIAQCPSLTAAAAAGALRISTIATGDTARLAIDLSASTAARVLGFGERRLAGRGGWDATMDWLGPQAGPRTEEAIDDPNVVADPLGGARLFWAEHGQGLWRIRQAHWSERLTVVTALGVSQQTAGGAWTSWHVVDGLPSDDVRALALDARGALWFATAAGLAERRADGVWTTSTTIDGLSSDNLRDVAVLPDGSLWIATPTGLSIRDAAGIFSIIGASPIGLIDADVLGVSADGRGNAWAATPSGVSRSTVDGTWRSWVVADGLPSGAIRRITAGPNGMVALAASTGVGLFDGTFWRSFGLAEGLPSADIRAVAWGADGTLYAATAAGLGIWTGRRWRQRTPANGLPAADLRSIAALPDGRLAIGTATGVMLGLPFAPAADWVISTIADGLAGPVVVGVHGGISTAVTLVDEGGGNREPRAATDPTGRTWLFWSRREETASTERDSWTIRLRRYDPALGTWDAVLPITTPPAAGAADRQPAPELDGAGFRVFFSSDRDGGRQLWSVDVDGLGAAGLPVQHTVGAAEISRPVPVQSPDATTWLISRSDAPVALAQVAVINEPGEAGRDSERVPEARALSLNAGARSPVMGHASRNLGRRSWGDYYVYTPEYPHLTDSEVPTQSHIYTRRTIALYLRQSPIGVAMTAESVGRLRQLVMRFLPVNLRLALIVAPDPLVEFVYAPGIDIGESWSDDIPFVDVLGGLADSSEVEMPGVGIIISNSIDDLTFSAALLATLRRRTWFPDLL